MATLREAVLEFAKQQADERGYEADGTLVLIEWEAAELYDATRSERIKLDDGCTIPNYCHTCRRPGLQLVRPGKIQCIHGCH
jgi:hypothetical protein